MLAKRESERGLFFASVSAKTRASERGGVKRKVDQKGLSTRNKLFSVEQKKRLTQLFSSSSFRGHSFIILPLFFLRSFHYFRFRESWGKVIRGKWKSV